MFYNVYHNYTITIISFDYKGYHSAHKSHCYVNFQYAQTEYDIIRKSDHNGNIQPVQVVILQYKKSSDNLVVF